MASAIPRRGKRTSGIRAVAGMGMASVIHQQAIRTAIAPMRWAAASSAEEGMKRTMTKSAIPSQKPSRRYQAGLVDASDVLIPGVAIT